MTLILPPSLLDTLRRQVEGAYPHEACGLLGGVVDGDGKRVTRLVPVANAREDSPRNRYLIEPQAFRKGSDELEREGLGIVAVYHSHPDHPARPSEFDREHAWPRLSYVIVGVAAGRAGQPSSWVLADDRTAFREESIIIEQRTVSWQSRS